MSKYLRYDAVVFKQRQQLLAALAELGYPEVEEGQALPLFGYQGDQRPETAEMVIRRRSLGAASNDVGFVHTLEGYVPLVSEYDQRALHGGRFLAQLRTAYGEQVVEEVRRRLHGTSRRTVDAGGVVRITIRF